MSWVEAKAFKPMLHRSSYTLFIFLTEGEHVMDCSHCARIRGVLLFFVAKYVLVYACVFSIIPASLSFFSFSFLLVLHLCCSSYLLPPHLLPTHLVAAHLTSTPVPSTPVLFTPSICDPNPPPPFLHISLSSSLPSPVPLLSLVSISCYLLCHLSL